jgi:hypothetical protein
MGVYDPQVQAMRKAGFTEEEITDMLKCDKEIDQGKNLFPLDPELEPGAKKARRADRTDNPKKVVRERKEDTDKRTLINALSGSLECLCDDIEIVNPEREFLFTFGGRKFKVVLSAPRT